MPRTIVMIALRKYGYNVIENESGEEALRRFGELDGAVDLVLTDVVMPGMNGRELMERLKAQSPDVKVLFMSGYTQDALENQDLQAEKGPPHPPPLTQPPAAAAGNPNFKI